MKQTPSRGALLLAMLTICAIPAFGAEQRPKTRAKKLPAAAAAAAAAAIVGPECPAGAGGAGFRAFIDPVTGELREPTPEEARAFGDGARADAARSTEALEVLVHPDGMVSVVAVSLNTKSLVVAKKP